MNFMYIRKEVNSVKLGKQQQQQQKKSEEFFNMK